MTGNNTFKQINKYELKYISLKCFPYSERSSKSVQIFFIIEIKVIKDSCLNL